ncbi:proton/sodium-translocating pyrophosphatase [Mucisphaera sp.]|uniref:proton/sodium-translocating pyrophosphatase n=1 Tax=Mucisphaera sp. TaxID=2913024 RepID=UPI003D0A1954
MTLWTALTIAATDPALVSASLPAAYYLAPAAGVLALLFAWRFYAGIMAQSEGDPAMVKVAAAVRAGAYAYLAQQRNVVMIVFAALIVLLVLMSAFLDTPQWTPLGVAVAGLFSGLCGYFGMKTATNASARTAAAARESLNQGLQVAFRAGAVMGLCVTGFALIDIAVWFAVLYMLFGAEGPIGLVHLTTITLSFAMGASLQALFARVGGGIYTKAADVGADLVGKVEAGIPEDDARNPATIADNVGDNVGDVAGMGADLYESYYGSILAAMALASAAAMRLEFSLDAALALVVAAPAVAGLGIVCSILAIHLVRAREGAGFAELLRSLHAGVFASSAMIVVGSLGVLYWLLGGIEQISVLGIWGAIVAGLVAGLVIARGTEFYTSYEHSPTRRISKQAETGPATVIIAGIAEGMTSTWVPLLTVVVAIMSAFTLAGGGDEFLMGVFGVGIAAVGMLATLGITLATDAYGPIADNAGGNAEMTHQPPHVRERTDMLDSLGNTTAATGKGFAIGSAALTALALLAAYVITVQASLTQQVVAMEDAGPFTSLMASADGTIPEGVLRLEGDYVGHGLFRITDPGTGSIDAGLLMSHQDRNLIERTLAAGDADLTVLQHGSRRFYDAQLRVGAESYNFEVVPAGAADLTQLLEFYQVSLMNPQVLCGLFIGVMLVMVFCAMTMNAVGRAAYSMMLECRRQFVIMKQGFVASGMTEAQISDPRQWPDETHVDGKQYPDYASCVAISTTGALREMVLPSMLAVVVPILTGLILGVPGTMGLLAGTLVCGFAVAIFMANAGGAWDNAKKYIETGEQGGKGSADHKATVVGDTVGDPFKDTSGPSLNILIKLVSIVSVVFAGVIVRFSPEIGSWIGL